MVALGYPLDYRIFNYAISRGDLKVLEWLTEADCPQDPSAVYYALLSGDKIVIRWLAESGYPSEDRLASSMLLPYAFKGGDSGGSLGDT